MEIEIKEILIPTLEKLASQNSLTPNQYATNIVTTFLESQYKGSILDKIKVATVEELVILKEEKISDLQKVVTGVLPN